jgi:hypothetical protein
MTGVFDFGLVILGLAAIALVAGLAAVVWEALNRTKASALGPKEELQKSIPPKTAPDPSFEPAPEGPLTVSKFLTPPPKVPTDKPIAEPQKLPQTQSSPASSPEISAPPAEPAPKPPSPHIEEIKLENKTVTEDHSYAESLQEQVEADEPSEAIEPEEQPEEAEDGLFLACTGNATWISAENDRDATSINRAIFRNGFNSLVFSFDRFAAHDWPLEITCFRETEKSYKGTARHRQISVHCVVNLRALQGSNLEFDGWWQIERHDGRRHLRYRVSGLLRASQQFPELPAAPAPVAPQPPVVPAAEPFVPLDISIPVRQFSLGYGEYRGNPFIEILENGRPWGETHRNAKKHFSFGRRKARMILLAEKQIREFVTSDGEGPATSPASVQGGTLLDGAVVIIKEDSFNIGTRRLPFPHIKLTHKEEGLGFGLSKADALLSLWPKIEEWAKRK